MKLEKASLLHTKPKCKVPRPTPKLQNQNLNKLQPVCSAMELWFIYSGTPYSLPMHWSSCMRDSTNTTNRKQTRGHQKQKAEHGQLSLQIMKSYLKTKRLPKKGEEKKEMGRGRR
jgi:hypothetical protein